MSRFLIRCCLPTVMRTQGSLRVVLNTKVFVGMTIERASPKSVRVTALDEDGLVKIFLIVVGRRHLFELCKDAT